MGTKLLEKTPDREKVTDFKGADASWKQQVFKRNQTQNAQTQVQSQTSMQETKPNPSSLKWVKVAMGTPSSLVGPKCRLAVWQKHPPTPGS